MDNPEKLATRNRTKTNTTQKKPQNDEQTRT